MDSRIIRSYLFVPANRPERFAKACAAGADSVIIDLEDAVPPPDKSSARAAVSDWLANGGSAMIRVNGAGTEHFEMDLQLAKLPNAQGIVLPKAEEPAALRRIAECAGRPLAIDALIESARGFANAQAIAQTSGVRRLIFGSIDFQVDLGIAGDQEELLYFRSNLVLVSRLANLQPPVDGVTTSIDNLELVRSESLRAKRMGFAGKLCIHPKQVAVVNQSFDPSPEEAAWARRILAGARAANGAAVSVDGAMVDLPVIKRAEAILARLAEDTNP